MSRTKNKIKVLFLCTSNSCRSQITEGWAKNIKGDMEVPCCFGLTQIARKAIASTSGVTMDFKDVTIDLQGNVSKTETIEN